MAGKAYDAIKALLNAAGDAGDALEKMLFGTSGSKVNWPEGKDYAYPRDTGQLFGSVSPIAYLLDTGIGRFLDDRSVSWAVVATNAASVSPTYVSSAGFDTATPISKDESNNRITLTFDDAYASASYVVLGRSNDASPSASAWCYDETKNTGSVRVEFYRYDTAAKQSINSRTCFIFVMGER